MSFPSTIQSIYPVSPQEKMSFFQTLSRSYGLYSNFLYHNKDSDQIKNDLTTIYLLVSYSPVLSATLTNDKLDMVIAEAGVSIPAILPIEI